MARPAGQSCLNCDYFVDGGFCCRFGPTSGQGRGPWPPAASDDWCPYWNVTPQSLIVQGQQGSEGPQGPAGVDASNLTASVSGAGPGGGNDGDHWIKQDSGMITLYYKQAGQWQIMMRWLSA